MFHEEGRGVLEFAVFCMHAKSSAGQHGVFLTFSISNSTMYYSIYSTAHHIVLQIKNGIWHVTRNNVKHVLMPFAKKWRSWKNVCCEVTQNNIMRKRCWFLILDSFVFLFKRLKVGLFDVENGSGASATDEKQVLYFPSIRMQQKGEKTNWTKRSDQQLQYDPPRTASSTYSSIFSFRKTESSK